MNAPAMVLLTALTLISTGPPDTDLDRLQGAWKRESMQPPSDAVGQVSEEWVTIQGNSFAKTSSTTTHGTFTLEPGETPGVFIITKPSPIPTSRISLLRGIRKVNGDLLMECTTFGRLPADFTSTPENRNMLVVWQRIRDPKTNDEPAGSMAGTWKFVSMTIGGKINEDPTGTEQGHQGPGGVQQKQVNPARYRRRRLPQHTQEGRLDLRSECGLNVRGQN